MYARFKYELKNLLPVYADEPYRRNPDARRFVTLSLKRSGQHAVINWVCNQAEDIIHLNHCYFERRSLRNWITPVNNRVIIYKKSGKIDSGIQNHTNLTGSLSSIDNYKHILHSFEDVDIEDRLLRKYVVSASPVVIIILRDPYNWLASTMKRKDCSHDQLLRKKNILIRYLEYALGLKSFPGHPIAAIDYNKWVTQKEHRMDVCKVLDIPFSDEADQAIFEVPDFGGGSSFDGINRASRKSTDNYFQRWKGYASDPEYIELLNDAYLDELTEQFFQIDKPF